MKKFIFIFVFLCCIFLTACGAEDPDAQNPSQQGESPADTKELVIRDNASSASDIISQAEELFHFDVYEQEGHFEFLGMQFYQGEPVQLLMEVLDAEGNSKSGRGYTSYKPDKDSPSIMEDVTANIYLYRADQSRELLVKGLPANDPHIPHSNWNADSLNTFSVDRIWDYADYSSWYVDREGCCYCWWEFDEGNDGAYTFLKMDAAGNTLYEVLLDQYLRVSDILELPDGTAYLVIKDRVQGVIQVTEFDPATGELSESVSVKSPDGSPYSASYSFSCGVGEDGSVCVLLPIGIYRLDLSDGTLSEILAFSGTTYTSGDSSIDMTNGWLHTAVRSLEDGSAEVLWYNGFVADVGSVGAFGIRECLRPADMGRIPVTIRGATVSSWLKKQAARFNRTNDTWQIVVEEFASSNAVDLEEYARLTSVQIATGGGPDMFYGGFMDDYIYGMTEKGALTDLAPFLTESGIRQEDYLPLVFDVWRDGGHVYSVTPQVEYAVNLYTIDTEALDEAVSPDIMTLADALLAWEEDASFYMQTDPENVLRWFLRGSDSLLGMVDREGGSCDFSGELFAKLLETAKRYGSANARNYHILVRSLPLNDFYRYDSRRELAASGRTVCGILFDDGYHGTVTSEDALAINALSKSQEGAWEFLRFLLDDTTQANASRFPVKKNLLTAWVEEQAAGVGEEGMKINGSPYYDYGEQVKPTKTYFPADMTQERIKEYLEVLEGIRALPARNAPLLDIICEEAAHYFNGNKSAEDTAKVIENRVQLYLDEGR